jgi:hypothetical protein
MNDVGGPHAETGSDPIGVEIQAQAFAFATADALNNVTFYKYRIEYKGKEPLTNAYITIFADPDLGAEYEDDYIGSNPELGIGYVYNSDNDDVGGFGSPPPALGYDFFQGPIVDEDVPGVGDDMAPDTLGMTKFGYFNNETTPIGTPFTADEYFNNMTGIFTGGQVWSEGGNGTNPDGNPVDYIYPGVPGTYWSEPCATPGCGEVIPGADRRFIQSTGPFEMNPGDVQEVVFGIVWATGDENYNPNTTTNSVAAMFAADELAQIAYDVNFELPPGPPAPIVDAFVNDGQVTLTWTPNGALGYDQLDVLIVDPEVEDRTYTFEGYEVYSLDEPGDINPELLAIYDIDNGVTRVINETVDLATEQPLFVIVADGEDSGLQFFHEVQGELTNLQDYTFGVRAYAVSPNSSNKVLRSSLSEITVRPRLIADGRELQSEVGDAIELSRVEGSGIGVGINTARVVNPLEVQDADYSIEYVSFESEEEDGAPAILFNVLRDGVVVFDATEFYEDFGRVPAPGEVIVDGISFGYVTTPTVPELDADRIADFAGDGAGVGEVATPSGTVCPADTDDPGCATYGLNTAILLPVEANLIVDGDTTVINTYSENSPDAQNQYFVAPSRGTSFSTFGAAGLSVAAPDDFELRFTEECASGGCYAVYSTNFAGEGTIATVPFEAWNVGRLDDDFDDYRMIPFLRANERGVEVSSFADTFTGTLNGAVRPDGSDIPVTEVIYMMVPDRENGYEAFAAQAQAFGVGNLWDPATDGDNDNPDPDVCERGDYYVDFCYRNAGSRSFGLGNFVIADVAGDGTTPEAGTVIRFRTTPKPDIADGDIATFDASEFITLDATQEALQASMDAVNVVPNPYRGRSVYERGGESRVARFFNLPDRATIRIFTLSGNLIRTLESNGDRELDWDLNTTTGLPVASGMYLIHVEGRDASGNSIGEKILKFGVVQREIRFNNF